MSQMIVDYCVDSYERKPKAQKDDRLQFFKSQDFTSIRQAFSKSINSIARDETILFDKFSNLTKELRKQSKDKTRDHSKAIELMDHQLAEAIIEAESLSSRVKDILDELSILEATVQYQQDVQRAMKKQNARKAMKKESFLETELTATYIINDIKGLGSVAERVHAAVNTTLSLQQSEIANLQAKLSIEHAKLSIEHAELATRQGRVLMVFTVVTILFLPMSFLTSLFALDVASFEQAPAWALIVIFLVSLALFIPAVCFAFAWEGSKRFVLGPMRKLIHHAMFKPLGLDAKEISEQSIGGLWKLAWSSNRTRDVKSNSNPAVGSSEAPVQVAPQGRTGLSDLLRFRSRRHKDVEEGNHKQ
ncbi:hypothetical protein CGCSCA1_v001584 [Colletotrichum siamense]|nr:hypothetical protein CGCSCA1_v001584 [Colletotrichum siamense]